MPYHIDVAAPPAIRTIKRIITNRNFNSASPIQSNASFRPLLPPALAVPDTPSKLQLPPPHPRSFSPVLFSASCCWSVSRRGRIFPEPLPAAVPPERHQENPGVFDHQPA